MKNSQTKSQIKNKKDRPISYLTRYWQSTQIDRQSKLNRLVDTNAHWNHNQIQERRERILQKLNKEKQVSCIRIEEQLMESQFFKDDYLELQMQWLKKIDEIKEQTHKLKVINSKELKTINSLRQQMEIKQQKLRQLEDRIQDNNLNCRDTAIGDDEDQSQSSSKHQLNIIQENQSSLLALQNERQNLIKQNLELQANIKKIKSSISALQPQVIAIQNKQRQVKNAKDSLLNELRQLKAENKELERYIERDCNIDEELDLNVREYIELGERVFIIKEIQKLQELMIAKQQQDTNKHIYAQNSKFYKQKCKELETVNVRVKQKERIAQKLTFDIKQKSIEQLNLYNY